MKTLRIVCFIIGLTGWGRFLYIYLSNAPTAQNQSFDVTLLVSVYAYSILCTVICVVLAGRLKRSKIGWGIFAFFLGYIACLVLPFLKEADPQKKTSWWSNQQGSSSSWGSGYGTSYYSRKTCTACGREVPSDSHAGQHCPHCGVYWSAENKHYK
jgi:hypothetical protein